MEIKETLQEAFIKHVQQHGEWPKSVYIFSKDNDISEEQFYNHFGSFEGLEQSIWSSMMESVINEVESQEIWSQYTSREKALSLFFAFFEFLKSRRSYAITSIKASKRSFGFPDVLRGLKAQLEAFNEKIIQEGLESNELENRRFLVKRYKDALWVQFTFLLRFWLSDTSSGFEKTDEAIEKGINVTFDLFQRSPIDNLLDYGKFLFKNSGIKV